MFGIWLAVAEGTLLGFEAQRVIALRAMKIAAGGSSARSEVSRMVTEKVSAGAEAVAILTRGGSGRRVDSPLPDARKGKCATAVEIGAGEPGLIPPWLSGTKFRANFWLSVPIRLKNEFEQPRAPALSGVPSGARTSFRLPRFRIEIRMRMVTVWPSPVTLGSVITSPSGVLV